MEDFFPPVRIDVFHNARPSLVYRAVNEATVIRRRPLSSYQSDLIKQKHVLQ